MLESDIALGHLRPLWELRVTRALPRLAAISLVVSTGGCECQLGRQWAIECADTLDIDLPPLADEECRLVDATYPAHPQAVQVRFDALEGVDTSSAEQCEAAFQEITDSYVVAE